MIASRARRGFPSSGPSFEVIAIVLILIVAALAVGFYLSQRPTPQSPAKVSVSIQSFGLISGQSAEFPVQINNKGGDARQVTISLSSPLGSISIAPTDVPSGKTITTYGSISLPDVPDGNYLVGVSYTYSDVNGSHTQSGSSFNVFAMPNLKLTGFSWQGASILSAGKDNIGPNDRTTCSIQVQSLSVNSIYTGLSLSASFSTQTEGLTITPSSQQINDIGPQGTSQSYTFTIQSSNAPPGTYSVAISVGAGGYTSASQTVQLTIS
jgi:hypothetical protein